MPIFIKWLTPLIVIFLVALITNAPDRAIVILIILIILSMAIATIRAIIMSRDTIKSKSHIRNRKDDWLN